MLYRRFGRTNLSMPVLSCGGMRYQNSWKDEGPDTIPDAGQQNLEATIRRSLELGINHIETARGYGTSELQLGRILPTLPRDRMIVQTKVGPTEDPQQFLANFERSMSLLKLEYVDLLGLHGINTPELLQWSIRPGGCLAAARKLQRQGRVRHVGFSTHASVDVILQAVNHEGDGGFDYVNLHWYYILRRNWPAVEAATKRDMGVFIISPSEKGGKLFDPPAKLVELTRPVHPIIFNDWFCLQHEQVHTLSVGAARPSDFDLHVEAVNRMEEGRKLVPQIDARLRAAMKAATGVEHPEDGIWTLPEHEHAPGGMNLPLIVWLGQLAKGWGMVGYGEMRYNLLGNGGHWFPGLNAGRLAEVGEDAVRRAAAGTPYADTIIQRLKDAHEQLGGAAVKRLSQSD